MMEKKDDGLTLHHWALAALVLTVVRLRKQKRIHCLGFGNQLGNDYAIFFKTLIESNDKPLNDVSNFDRIMYNISWRFVIHGNNVKKKYTAAVEYLFNILNKRPTPLIFL